MANYDTQTDTSLLYYTISSAGFKQQRS